MMPPCTRRRRTGAGRTYVAAEGIAAYLHLFSDGRFADVRQLRRRQPGPRIITVSASRAPTAVDNVGIVTFNALRDEKDANKLQAFVRVLNYRPRRGRGRLRLEVRSPGSRTSRSMNGPWLSPPGP